MLVIKYILLSIKPISKQSTFPTIIPILSTIALKKFYLNFLSLSIKIILY